MCLTLNTLCTRKSQKTWMTKSGMQEAVTTDCPCRVRTPAGETLSWICCDPNNPLQSV